MAEPPKIPTAARARPLPDLPVAAAAAQAAELSRRWAVALVLDRPPQQIGEAAEPAAHAALVVEDRAGERSVRIVDERGEPGPAAAGEAGGERRQAQAAPRGRAVADIEREIAVRDQRSAHGPSVWIESI